MGSAREPHGREPDSYSCAVTEAASETASWRALLDRRYLSTCTVLAGGVMLLAINEMMTASLMPTAIRDISGERLYAWVVTLFLGGSVVSAAVAFSVLRHNGARRSYLIGLATIAVGSLMCGLAPNMEVLVAGRAVQGAAGGLLAGLGYAVIRASLPRILWSRVSALLSVMVGLQVFIAPAIGGLFVQLGAWRWAYAVTVLVAAALAVVVLVAFDPTSVDQGIVAHDAKVPYLSVTLIAAAMLAVSCAQIPKDEVLRVGLLFTAAVLVEAFLIVDRRSPESVLPPSAFASGPLKWTYLTIALLMGALMVDAYVPLFGQRFADLTPLEAGLLSGALTLGWMVSQVVSAPLTNQRIVARVIVAGPLTMLAGLTLTAVTQRADPPSGIIAIWALALALVGVGCGSAYPHLLVRVMAAVDGPAESRQAAVAINIVAQFSAALAVGVAGVVDVIAGDPLVAGDLPSAPWLLLVFVVPALGAVLAAYRATRIQP